MGSDPNDRPEVAKGCQEILMGPGRQAADELLKVILAEGDLFCLGHLALCRFFMEHGDGRTTGSRTFDELVAAMPWDKFGRRRPERTPEAWSLVARTLETLGTRRFVLRAEGVSSRLAVGPMWGMSSVAWEKRGEHWWPAGFEASPGIWMVLAMAQAKGVLHTEQQAYRA